MPPCMHSQPAFVFLFLTENKHPELTVTYSYMEMEKKSPKMNHLEGRRGEGLGIEG